ncbi:MAG: AAA family ATPase [Saprospiraceae bacterium]|nr:AAA family ATPase [Saprospiraceae bacterium]
MTKHAPIYRLAINGGMYFLSRPRRFGKSLMVSTLKELFEGNRVLFKNLWIEDKWDWSLCVRQNMSREVLLSMMKDWYNGFSWDGIHSNRGVRWR